MGKRTLQEIINAAEKNQKNILSEVDTKENIQPIEFEPY